MLRGAAWAAACAFAAAAAFGALGDVAGSFPAPAPYPLALARSGSYLYVLCDPGADAELVYRVKPTSGSVQASYPAVGGDAARGLAFSPGCLYQGYCAAGPRVYRLNSSNGNVYGSFALVNTDQRGLAPLCTGDAGIGTTAIIVPDDAARRVYLHEPATGSVVSSFDVSEAIGDPAYDWRNGIVWGGSTLSPYVYGFDTAGSLVASFASPAATPGGMTYYGEYLWLGAGPPHYIYLIHCPGDVGVRPASMGKIKTLYR